MSDQLLNLTGVKLVDQTCDIEYDRKLDLGTVYFRENETRTYQCRLLDTAGEAPERPLNIGRLSPIALIVAGTIKIYAYTPSTTVAIGYYGGGVKYLLSEWVSYTDAGIWLCENRHFSRDYSLPLSTIYTETWHRVSPWRLFSSATVPSSSAT